MLVLLNLTLVPVMYLFIPAALIGNATLPAQPLAPDLVSAALPNGTAVPVWIVDSKVFVLSGGEPVKVTYVARYYNSSGTIVVPIDSPYEVLIRIPPGTYPVDVPDNAEIIGVNMSGVYLAVPPGTYNVTYTLLVREEGPVEAGGEGQPNTTAALPTVEEGGAEGTPTQTGPTAPAPDSTIILPVLLIGAVLGASMYIALRRRGTGCGGLGETDRMILEYLERVGGEAYRQDIAHGLGLPPTTLHKHLHKLARRGMVRLVDEQRRHRVVLVRRC